MRSLMVPLILLTALLSRGSPPTTTAGQPQTPGSHAATARQAPDFKVKDIAGQEHTASELAGHGGVIYFFCGCEPCHKVARLWGQIQRGGAVPLDAGGKPAGTLVFFFGEEDGARTFVQETGLDPERTVMIADPAMEVGRRYGVETCPRAFVLGVSRQVVYTNTRKDDRAQSGSTTVLVSRVVQALRDGPKSVPPQEPATLVPTRETTGGLVAVPEKGDEAVSPVKVIRHLGEFARESTPIVDQRLLLVNRGKEPFQIAGVEGSCGCTDIVFFAGDRRRKPGARTATLPDSEVKHSLTLPQGGAATLRVRLNVGQVEAGRHRKYAWVLQPGTNEAAVTLCLDFVVRTSVTAGSRRVEFGLVKAGEQRTVSFTISLPEGKFVPPHRPALVSTNPSIRVHPSGGVTSTLEGGRPVVQISYDLTLSPKADLGPIAGSLVLAAGKTTKKPTVIAAFGGEVVGEVRVLPGTILFGTVPAGKEHRQRATLILERGDVRAGVKLATSAGWLQAKIVDAPNGQSTGSTSLIGPYAHLDVTLTPRAPRGPIEAAIAVTTASGQKLMVPVVGTITK